MTHTEGKSKPANELKKNNIYAFVLLCAIECFNVMENSERNALHNLQHFLANEFKFGL